MEKMWLADAPIHAGNETAERIATAAVTFKYQRKDKIIYNVKFEALADSTQPAGQRLAKIVDFNNQGS